MSVSLVEARRTPGTLRLWVSDLGDARPEGHKSWLRSVTKRRPLLFYTRALVPFAVWGV